MWEVSNDPVDTPEGPVPLRGGFGGFRVIKNVIIAMLAGKPPDFLGDKK